MFQLMMLDWIAINPFRMSNFLTARIFIKSILRYKVRQIGELYFVAGIKQGSLK